MSTRSKPLSIEELNRTFTAAGTSQFPPILTPKQFAELIGLSIKTVYHWLALGRLDGSIRRRGKHVLIWRDRAVVSLFNSPDWSSK